jgi:hypothetical protein
MTDEQLNGTRILFKTTSSLMITITVIFFVGFAYHFKKSVDTHDEYFANRINPSAFTVKAPVSQQMWELVERNYEEVRALDPDISKTNFLRELLEE